MNITIDPTIPGALGSFGLDDEGTPAAARDAVRDGVWVGVLAGAGLRRRGRAGVRGLNARRRLRPAPDGGGQSVGMGTPKDRQALSSSIISATCGGIVPATTSARVTFSRTRR